MVSNPLKGRKRVYKKMNNYRLKKNGPLTKKLHPYIQRIRHSIILECLRMFQLLQFVFQSLQLFRWEIPVFEAIDDSLHHILANIVGTVHVIEVVIMLIFHKVVSEAFKYFQQDGYSFDKIALA